MSGSETFKEELSSKGKFYNFLTGKKIGHKDLEVWNALEMKVMKCYHDWYLKCDVSLLADMFENLEIVA